MRSPLVLLAALVQDLLPDPVQTDSPELDYPIRINKYRELFLASVSPSDHAYAREGSELVAVNPTPSTGFTWVAAQTTFVDTTPNFYIYNADKLRSIELHSLKLIMTAAPTGATAIHYAFVIDKVDRLLSTDNTQLVVPTCPRSGLASKMAWAGAAGQDGSRFHVQNNATASAIAASTRASKRVARGTLGGLGIAGDVLVIVFGRKDAGAQPALTAVEGAGQPGRRVDNSASIIIDPGHSLCGHIWMPGSSASFNPEMEASLIVR